MKKELSRGGQVFYLYNFVDGIDACAAKIAKAIPEARITVAHGKMDKDQLEDIWEEMLTGKIDILVCTTIIETAYSIKITNNITATKLNLVCFFVFTLLFSITPLPLIRTRRHFFQQLTHQQGQRRDNRRDN